VYVSPTNWTEQIETFATKFGPQAISFLGAGLLMINYIGAITAAVRVTFVSHL
jgi:hypothetical protein